MGIAYLAADRLLESERFRTWLLRKAEQKLDLKVSAERMGLSGAGLFVENLDLSKRSGVVLFACRRCEVGLDPFLFVTGRIRRVKLVQPIVRVTSGGPGKPLSIPPLSFGKVEIENGEILIAPTVSKPIPLRIPRLKLLDFKLADGERLRLSLDLPWLGTSALVSAKIRTEPPYVEEGQVEVREGSLERLNRLLGAQVTGLRGKLDATIGLAGNEKGAFRVTADGELKATEWPSRFSARDGRITLEGILQDQELRFEVKIVATSMPEKIGGFHLEPFSGPVEIVTKGILRLARSELELTEIRLQSSAATAQGYGELRGSTQSGLRLNLDLHSVRLAFFQPFLRAWVDKLNPKGAAAGHLEVSANRESRWITGRLFSPDPIPGPKPVQVSVSFQVGASEEGQPLSVTELHVALGKAAKRTRSRLQAGSKTMEAALDRDQARALLDVVPGLRAIGKEYPAPSVESLNFFFDLGETQAGSRPHGNLSIAEVAAGPLKARGIKLVVNDFRPQSEKTDLMLKVDALALDHVQWGLSDGTSGTIRTIEAGGILKRTSTGITGSGQVRVVGGSFSTLDGLKAGEHLDLDGKFSFLASESEKRRIETRFEADVNSLELLLGTLFVDFKGRNVNVTVNGSYHGRDGALDLHALELGIPAIGEFHLTGRLDLWPSSSGKKMRINLLAPQIDLESAFDLFVRQPFRLSRPFLDRVVVSGKGTVACEINLAGRGLSASGEIGLDNAGLHSKSGTWSVKPISGAMPFSIASEADAASAGDVRAGSLQIRGGHWGGSALLPLRAAPYLWNNRFGFEGAINTSLFGGTARFSNIRGENILALSDGFSLSANLDGINLSSLSEALGWPRLPGKLTAKVPMIRLRGEKIATEGELTIEIFGGTVRINEMEIDSPLSPLPSLRMDTVFEGIDLSQASGTLTFGKISGVLEGTIRNLVFAAGQPSGFVADLHTTPRPGVSQRIDVEALNKISILGTGGSLGVLNTGIYRLFQFYRYQKMGFKARLQNDRLVLQGVEKRDGKDYLVVGTFLPPTVNVISHAQEVSFNELVRRLERIKTGPDKESREGK